jgi:hypothetical protein
VTDRVDVAALLAALAAVGAVAVSPAPATADPAATATAPTVVPVIVVDLAGGACARLDAAVLRRAADTEARAVMRDRARTMKAPAALALTLRCRDDSVELTGSADDGGATLPVTRRFDLGDAPAAGRERYLALALAEIAALVVEAGAAERPVHVAADDAGAEASSDSDRDSEPAHTALAAGRRAGATTRGAWAAAVDGPRPRVAGVGVIGRVTFSPAGRMKGAGVRVAGLGLLSADAIFEVGDRSAMLGHVSIKALSLGLSVEVGRSWGRLRVAGGPGARLGLVHLEGVPADRSIEGRSFTGPTAGPFALAGARYVVAERLEIYTAGEAGVALVGVHSNVETDADIRTRGTWLSVDLGARWGW